MDLFRRWGRAPMTLAAALGVALAACLPSYTLVEGSGGGAGGKGGSAGRGGSDSDPRNCGATGHDCLGGECTGSICQPFVVASGLLAPTGLGLTQDLVVFSYSDGVATCPRAGCGVGGVDKVVIASTSASPGTIAVGGGYVYWTNQGMGRVSRCVLPSCSGQLDIVSGLDIPGNLALDANNVYVASDKGGNGELRRCPLSGCGTLDEYVFFFQPTEGPPQRLGVSAGSVYWTTTDNRILRCGPGGCPATPPVLASDVAEGALWLSDGVAYFAGLFQNVLTCPLTGCEGTAKVVAETDTRVTFIVVDATHVYWTEAKSGTVRRTLIGGDPVTVIASGQENPTEMAVDDKAVCWLNRGSAGPGSLACVAK